MPVIGSKVTVAGHSSCGGNLADVGPHCKCTPFCSILAGSDVIAAAVEGVADLLEGGEERRRPAGSFKPLYLSLERAGRLVRVLGSIVEYFVLSARDRAHYLAIGRTVAKYLDQ